MFTGIVEACAAVSRVEPRGAGLRLWIRRPRPDWEVAIGESVAVSGCCLTVAMLEREAMVFDLSPETLERTWFGDLSAGAVVNLERALRLSDRLGGHLVSGHVDGGGRVVATRDLGDGGRETSFEVDPGLERYLVDKGSVTLDGVSLTVCRPVGRRFAVALIPTTLALTSLGSAEAGRRVNVEVDLIGKWVARFVGPFV
jgi:riboflavin synthase